MKDYISKVTAVLLLLLLNFTNMNAQNIGDKSQKLKSQEESIIPISALTAIGDIENLKTALASGLDAGLTVNEVKEVLVQLYAYAGFPRSLNGLGTLMKVLEERKAKGIVDNEGKEATEIKDTTDKYERGRKVIEDLTKVPQSKPAPGFGAFAPRIDAFLKEHLFADIFDSDVLTWRQRELATVSALAAMSGVSVQLQAHIAMGRNVGIKESELLQIADLIEKHVSKPQAAMLRRLLVTS